MLVQNLKPCFLPHVTLLSAMPWQFAALPFMSRKLNCLLQIFQKIHSFEQCTYDYFELYTSFDICTRFKHQLPMYCKCVLISRTLRDSLISLGQSTIFVGSYLPMVCGIACNCPPLVLLALHSPKKSFIGPILNSKLRDNGY